MRYCIVLFSFLLIANLSHAQKVNTRSFKSIQPKDSYSNISSIPVYSDANASAFVIFIKNQVPKHYHATHTETVIILAGRGEMYLGGQFFKVKAGDQMIIPPGTAHAVIVRSKKALKVLSIQSPYFKNIDRIMVED